jgi:ABC-type polysaccharide/polyol phosphate transport system ATPase subunit
MTAAVRFEDVTKHYRAANANYSSIRDEVVRVVRRRTKSVDGVGTRPAALRHVSFEVEEGESFALIGPNGAGKTTALKLVSRISYPSSGRIEVVGRIASLIEVGSGVHPELTGRENIWLYGQILGMRRREVAQRFTEIVEFGDLGHVLDYPVKTYSSGMQLRLGFAIASHLDPDIFVVDEALAVGDANFQARCVDRMSALVKLGRTLIFVSHNLSAVEMMCTRGIFLSNGEVVVEGTVREALAAYVESVETGQHATPAAAFRGSRYLGLEGVHCTTADGSETFTGRTFEPVTIHLDFIVHEELRSPFFSIGLSDGRAEGLLVCTMLLDGGAPDVVQQGRVRVSCVVEALPLLPRVYELFCSVRTEHGYGDLFEWQPVGSLRVVSATEVADAPATHSTGAPVYAPHRWEVHQ